MYVSFPLSQRSSQMTNIATRKDLMTSKQVTMTNSLPTTHWELEKYLTQGIFFSIVHQSTNAIVLTDAKYNIIYANCKFEDITGYALAEVLGKNPRVLQSGKTPKETYISMKDSLDKKEIWQGEFINVHRDGHEFVEEAVISPILNENGELLCYLAEKKDITALKKAETKIHNLAYYDSLTGLPSRAYFIEKLQRLVAEASPQEGKITVLFADLNRFKELNDTHGHAIGDIALKIVSKRFRSALGKDDLLARIGGDEFVILHRHKSDSSIENLSQAIANSLDENIEVKSYEHKLSVSIGSATWPNDTPSISELLMFSDIAMYKAKSLNLSYFRYDKKLGESSNREYVVSLKLEQAIAQRQFYLVYQPKVDLKTNNIIGAEALLRWEEPTLGSVSPVEFIPIAESKGLVRPIGAWVLQRACQQLREWAEQGTPLPGKLGVNVSIQQLESCSFLHDVRMILEKEGISPTQIELEITESVLTKDPNLMIKTLSDLTSFGLSISIDDFGTGYSSLAYLKKLRPQSLKIDKKFIDHLCNDIDDYEVIKFIIGLSQHFGLSVVAEGVEHLGQVELLKELGCDIAQGYLFSKPVKPNELVAAYKKHGSDY